MARLLMISDNHYNKHCGEQLRPAFTEHDLDFFADDFSPLASPSLCTDYDLLVLHCISGTCGNEPPGTEVEEQVKAWVDAGKPILLLHGSSAAFWHWPWWRSLVGWRWVRPNDPAGIPQSTHPKRPYNLQIAKTTHPLAQNLRAIELPWDEIYINLEQVCPSWTLMETTTDEGTFPMAHLHQLPSGSHIAAFIPGHELEVTQHPDIHYNISTIANWLLDQQTV